MIADISSETLESLADAYARTRLAEDRDRLCDAALPFVRRIATGVLRRLPPHFCIDDLIGDGCVGLLRAVDRYRHAQGATFETWATRLVRGAMLNGLRRMDAMPERVRRDARSLEKARSQIGHVNGRSPSDDEAATSAGLDARKLHAVKVALLRAAALSLDAPIGYADDAACYGDRIPATALSPPDAVIRRLTRREVGRAVSTLPSRERLIIASFYGGEASFRQIGDRLGISKQRVSQLHGRAIIGLRFALAQHADA
ncbi:MAG: sigma-70 family RNA polymerase sigma factor [Candidatus Eremiobacteraeota bacterium]|nr:sigma-70 family RNA polymerase sigma factor [Candidatus Eremiobacteraeota bacterium]MBC5826777.1 sigma-70 family RNA polymerase sigma factor [Candidatus Eremiobacteraeota bacterium]